MDAGKHIEEFAGSDVDDKSGQIDFAGFVTQPDKCWYELRGQVVYREVAEVFKRLQSRGHPRPRNAGNDDY